MTYTGRNSFSRSPTTKTASKGSYVRIRDLIKLKVLITVILFFSFWLLTYLDGVENLYNPRPLYKYSRVGKEYIVDTPGCRILNFPIFDLSLTPLFAKEPNPNVLNCDPENKGELVKSISTLLYVNSEVVPNFTDEKFTCCYQHFWRKAMRRNSKNDYPIKVDFGIRYSDECIPIIGTVKVDKQFVRTICVTESNVTIYEDYFTFAVDYNDAQGRQRRHRKPKKLSKSNQYSVLILGFDGLSRLNFLRQMPRTADFIESNQGVILNGYTKIGYNTFPNLVALLTGMMENDLHKTCYPTNTSVLDSCPWIWKLFKSQGYYTAMGEDSTLISTFSFQKRGFREKPVDYYLKSYFHQVELRYLSKEQRTRSTITCLGQKSSVARFIDAVHGFASNFKNKPSFGLFWLNGLSHDSLTNARLGDKLFRSTLDSLKTEGALDTTVLIVLSDHGMRWGPFRETYQGYFEERLPLAAIVLPEKIKRQYPQYDKNLRDNVNRLTTPFDIHETLKELLYMGTFEKILDVNQYIKGGRSVFRVILPTRTCVKANVPAEWCACFRGLIPRHPEDPFSQTLGRIVVEHINQVVRSNPQCVTLTLKKVRAIWSEVPNQFNTIMPSFFVISLETVPGDGIFETRVKYEGPELASVAGTISRLNSYKNDSTCVRSELKLYCFCGTAFKNDEFVEGMSQERYALMKAVLTAPPETHYEEAQPSKYVVEKSTLANTFTKIQGYNTSF